jgi:AcrR family transcriptional regulator
MSDVKPRPGQARRERAAATRRRIVASAYRLFCEHGYAPTTMEAIGRDAGVAVQTVYYVFRTKAQLLREVIEVTAAGEADPAPVMQRAWMQEALASPSAHRALALTVEHGTDIYARMAPLGHAIHTAAASEPDIDTYWQGVTAGRRAGMGELAATLADHGQLRAGLSPRRAADIMFVINSHETFLGLTSHAGWSLPEFKAWVYVTLTSQLLPPGRQPATATKDLSYHEYVNHH